MSRQRITYQPIFKGMNIQTDSQRGCIENILEGFYKRLEHMTNKHNQVSAIELVVTLPKSVTPDNENKVVADSIRSVRKTMSNRGVETQTCWIRETAPGSDHDRPHYHLSILANGSMCQSGMRVAMHLQKLISKRSSDSVNDPGNVECCNPDASKNRQILHPIEMASAIKIRKDKPGADKQCENVINRFSYNCKISQKGEAAPGKREYGFSSLPSNEKKPIPTDSIPKVQF